MELLLYSSLRGFLPVIIYYNIVKIWITLDTWYYNAALYDVIPAVLFVIHFVWLRETNVYFMIAQKFRLIDFLISLILRNLCTLSSFSFILLLPYFLLPYSKRIVPNIVGLIHGHRRFVGNGVNNAIIGLIKKFLKFHIFAVSFASFQTSFKGRFVQS